MFTELNRKIITKLNNPIVLVPDFEVITWKKISRS
jgi:hypothetical protein